jgi:hypothetical protein
VQLVFSVQHRYRFLGDERINPIGLLLWAAMLRVLFDFAVDSWSNPLGAGISDSRPSQKNAKERGTHCVGNARRIKSLGHPPGLAVNKTFAAFAPTLALG